MKRVLFLCTGNYYRSRLAEILFNHLAQERGLGWLAESSGLHVQADGIINSGPISRYTRQFATERNLPLEEPCRNPRQARDEEFAAADLVIAMKEAEHRQMMEEKYPHWAGKVRYWHIHDLDVIPNGGGLTDVESHVRKLVEQLAAGDTKLDE
ncbi:MAG TPA: low molecular weight phosphatase family protein [Phycisphaerae bacterium]|nr:low molecular weight phosphatase family protein [Phycisphaerae bacterium]